MEYWIAGGVIGLVAARVAWRFPWRRLFEEAPANAEVPTSGQPEHVTWEAGLGPLTDLLNDPTVSEIMVNRYDRVFVERRGKTELTPLRFSDDRHVIEVIRRIIADSRRRIDESSPMVDARLADGSRINAVLGPLATKGPCFTIRKFARDLFALSDLEEMGTLSTEMSNYLREAVDTRKNLCVSGGTGSGKTTLLNVLTSLVPVHERIITIEDAAELRLHQPNVVSLESRTANVEGVGAIAIRALVANALRMRPDRIVVGECRGAEALDMLQAMNTGHDGSLTTVHANSPKDTINRLETLTHLAGLPLSSLAIRQQIGAGIQVIVQTARLADGSRKVVEIAEIAGLVNGEVSVTTRFSFVADAFDDAGRVLGRFAHHDSAGEIQGYSAALVTALPDQVAAPKSSAGAGPV